MRTVLIGAVGSTEIVLRAMQEAGHAPTLLATLSPETGPRRHGDYVDLSKLVDRETQVVFVEATNDPAFIDQMRAVAPEIIFVVGWSQIVGPELRATASRHCIGFHPTLLPALRGRAAIGWTILLGLKQSGATLFEISEDVDDGPILAQLPIALDARETVATLADKLSAALAQMIRSLLPTLADGSATARPQPTQGISFCARRTAADNLIDWDGSQETIDRLVRASSRPYSGAFTFTRKRRVTIWAAEPCSLPYPYHAAAGQVVAYMDGDPIVRCGNGNFLRVTEYEATGTRLAGQVRFRARLESEEA